MAEVTQEEIIEIANGFLLNSPPGEFMEVVTDVRGLLEDDSIINDTAPATFRQYNTDQMLAVKSPNGDHEVLITNYGEINDSEYIDPRGNCVVQFDHIRQEVVGSRGIAGELDSEVESWRSAIDDAFTQYAYEHYQHGAATVYGSKEGGNYKVVACISSAKFNPNNFWNGRWRSIWTMTFKPKGQVNLTGNIKVNVHYYEDGNVMLTSNTNKSGNCPGGDPNTTAQNVVKHIARIEGNFHSALEQSYATMGETTFKALRRMLPITRQKIDWNRIFNYKLGSEAAASSR